MCLKGPLVGEGRGTWKTHHRQSTHSPRGVGQPSMIEGFGEGEGMSQNKGSWLCPFLGCEALGESLCFSEHQFLLLPSAWLCGKSQETAALGEEVASENSLQLAITAPRRNPVGFGSVTAQS